MPRSLAMCAIGRPLSNTSRTARSRSSSGYFLGAGIAEVLPLPRTKSWLRGLRETRPGSRTPGQRDPFRRFRYLPTALPGLAWALRRAGCDGEVAVEAAGFGAAQMYGK